MNRKIRILFNTEAHYLSTGYGVYTKELLTRLHNTGLYEIAELASFAEWNDPKNNCPWKFYPVKPDPNNQEHKRIYEANHINAFGAWLFESACIDFKPDLVFSIRDTWMYKFELTSPFRKYYKHVAMPTIDGLPQKDFWLDMYSQSDGVFSYSDWGVEQLKKYCPNARLLGSASPAAEYNLFKMPQSKETHKQSVGISKDIIVVGTVMRNQPRKLYPELISSFAKFLKEGPQELTRKTYLYLHTCWPDIGWDIPLLIKEQELQDKVIMTYICKDCGYTFPNQFNYAVTSCMKCGNFSARLPTTDMGVSREILANIIKSFDIYVQYSSSEGFGMPMVEAAACGVPVFAVDYSAMSDVVRKVLGVPVNVKHLSRETSTHRYMAIPDNDDFISKLISYLKKPKEVKAKHSFEIATAVRQHYNWDLTAQKWMIAINSLSYPNHEQTWLSSAKMHRIPSRSKIPFNLNNTDFIKWGLINLAGMPELLNTYTEASLIRDLNWECRISNIGGVGFNELSVISNSIPQINKFDKNIAADVMIEMGNNKNAWEQKRIE